MTRPQEANKMVIKLSEFMRYSLNSSGKVMSTLGLEMKHCSDYLEIEKVRFGDRLDVKTYIDETSLNLPVPAMMLQTLAENAVKHGLNDNEESFSITIKASLTNGFLQMEVINPFDIKDETIRKGTGTGLKNIRERLAKIYGRNDLMNIRREENKFHVTINLPYYGEENKKPDS